MLRASPGWILLTLGSVLATPALAHNYKLRTLYSFCAEANCADGAGPSAALVLDQAGNLYGTTAGGGTSTSGSGTAFVLRPDGRKWKHKTLYSFCSQDNCADGTAPTASLIVDTSGDLYGMTQHGGPYGNDAGVAFELLPNATGARWKYKQIYAFCAEQACLDGNHPSGGLAYSAASAGSPYDGTSPLFGTTSGGGNVTYGGVAFKIEPKNRKWKQTVVYNFCSETDCTDGADPVAPPVADSAGRLWGTTYSGGNDRGGGVLYSITGTNESVEYDFCSDTENCLDGGFPTSPVLLQAGRIVGTTALGGSNISNGFGTLFAVSGGTEQVLYTFCPGGRNCTHGTMPSSGVTEDASGNLFGIAEGDGDGVIYEFSSGRERVIYAFCSQANCADGSTPSGGLIVDAAGNLYGTTQVGGADNGGTVFELEY